MDQLCKHITNRTSKHILSKTKVPPKIVKKISRTITLRSLVYISDGCSTHTLVCRGSIARISHRTRSPWLTQSPRSSSLSALPVVTARTDYLKQIIVISCFTSSTEYVPTDHHSKKNYIFLYIFIAYKGTLTSYSAFFVFIPCINLVTL